MARGGLRATLEAAAAALDFPLPTRRRAIVMMMLDVGVWCLFSAMLPPLKEGNVEVESDMRLGGQVKRL